MNIIINIIINIIMNIVINSTSRSIKNKYPVVVTKMLLCDDNQCVTCHNN